MNFTLQSEIRFPIHTAIIMDGNGRWAEARGLPRIAGHRAGSESARRVVEAAPSFGIQTLTLYAFSSDNWKRPRAEVNALMELLADFLREERAESVRRGIRVSLIGRRDRLPPSVLDATDCIERDTETGTNLHLRLAIDYSARNSIFAATCTHSTSNLDELSRRLGEDVDLLIRSGGEQRLSDFLLWESAYAELFFSNRMWPDFSDLDLRLAVASFQSRKRRFGGLIEYPALGKSGVGQDIAAEIPQSVHQLRGDRWLR